jgi:hypothetical protein
MFEREKVDLCISYATTMHIHPDRSQNETSRE